MDNDDNENYYPSILGAYILGESKRIMNNIIMTAKLE